MPPRGRRPPASGWLRGRNLSAAKVERAIALSAEKYCSASAMLAHTATITHEFEVVDTATQA